MDQEKTSIPHLLETPKALSGGWRMRVNLMGAIVHGIGMYGFFDAFQWSHGSSYTISVLVHVLSMLSVIPDILYLQLDNCPGQNKNRFMIGFLALLVEMGVFKKIKLSFLMVGHTHEDIDQMFSRFSTWLNKRQALTMPDLITGFESCYTPRPTGMQIHEVYNFAEYLSMNNIQNHSRPHVYKIVKENDKAVIYYKKWTTDKEWHSCEGEHLLKDTSEIKPAPLSAPSTRYLEEKTEQDIKCLARFYKDTSLEEWYDRYFDSLRDQAENWEDKDRDIVKELLEKKNFEPPANDPDTDLAELINELNIPSYDDHIPPVIIGKKSNSVLVQNAKEIKVDDMVLLDMAKYGDEWPQVAKILSVQEGSYDIQWYKGSRTTAWTPATRRVKGCKGGKTEPYTETVHRCVIWHNGFSLTPSGLLPKAVRDATETYFD